MNNPNYRIGVFMWYDSNIKDYAEINYKINKLYCEKYGYTLIKSHERLYTNRKPHWERIPLLLKYINDDMFDYLIWIDADAYFYIDAPPIENVIISHLDKLIIFSGDTDIKNNFICEINSGFFILKSCGETKTILEKWGYDEELFSSKEILNQNYFGRGTWNDQAVLRLMYDHNILNLKNESIVIDYGILQHFNKSHNLKNKLYELKDTPFVFHSTNGNNMNFNNRVTNAEQYFSYITLNKYKQFINPNIQISKKIISDIIFNGENKKMLVFGLGYDSELWYNLTNKNTYFIEDNKDYINLNKNINSDNIIYHKYNGINVKNSLKLTYEQVNRYNIPKKILENAPYDIILVDGPTGMNDNCPGRLLPIFWSKKYLSKQGTIVYIDDSNRTLEKKCINRYYIGCPKYYFNERLGTIKIIL